MTEGGQHGKHIPKMAGGASAPVPANPQRDIGVCDSLRGLHAASCSGSERSLAAGSFPVSTAAPHAGLGFASDRRGTKAGRLDARVFKVRRLAAVLPTSPPRAQPRRGAAPRSPALPVALPTQREGAGRAEPVVSAAEPCCWAARGGEGKEEEEEENFTRLRTLLCKREN